MGVFRKTARGETTLTPRQSEPGGKGKKSQGPFPFFRGYSSKTCPRRHDLAIILGAGYEAHKKAPAPMEQVL
jgi:hypothetical protein